jgi:alkaline phosphatase
MRKLRVAPLVLLALAALAGARASEHEGPRRVVIFIGDGMGLTTVTLGRLAAERQKRPYAFDRFNVLGLASTRSADSVVTDSAAAATALSSGYKTNNHALGVDPELHPRRTLFEIAHKAGFATGLVTTTRITHATPAGYAAHVPDRDQEAEIADQYLEGDVDVLLGGGRHYVDARHQDALRSKGYVVVTDAKGLRAAKPEGRLAGVFADEHMSYEIERDPAREPSLREMTEKALDVLSRGGRPFIAMIEGGKIDLAAHSQDAPALVREQLAFADAIDGALERIEREGDLLVIVTADHSTGAVAISEKLDLDGLLAGKAAMETLAEAHPPEKLAYPDFKRLLEANSGITPTEKDLDTIHASKSPSWSLGHLVSLRRGVAFYDVDFQCELKTHGHEGSLVPVFAAGKGAATFAGTYENTRIALEVARLLGLQPPGAPLSGPGKRFY